MTREVTNASQKIADYFEGLRTRGHEPALSGVTGTVRFDITDGDTTDRWLVRLEKGEIAVSHHGAVATCNFRVDRELMEKLVDGDTNAMAAVLRNAAVPSGDLDLLLAVQRLFPGPRNQQRPAPIGRNPR